MLNKMAICAIVITLITLLIIRYFKSIMAYIQLCKAMRTIGGPKGHWLYGNVYRNRDDTDLNDDLKSMREYPEFQTKWVANIFGKVSVYEPTLTHNVLQKFKSKNKIYSVFKDVVGGGLVSSNGAEWKHYRKLLNPAFHNEMMKSYMNVFNKSALKFLQRLQDRTEFNVKEECCRFTVHIITEALYSENSLTEDESIEYLKAFNNLTGIFEKLTKNPLYFNKWIFSKTKYKTSLDESRKFLKELGLRSIQLHRQKKANDTGPKTILDILVHANNEMGLPISDEEIIGHLNTFMLAGYDTSASTLGWTLYLLALHQECQDKCRDEISQLLGLQDKNEVSWEDLSKLSYLTMCIKETLRLYPPAYATGRNITEDTDCSEVLGQKYKNLVLPKDTFVVAEVLKLHRNPEVWKDPDVYDPNRFTPENIAKRKPNSFIPFASGKRNCIGQNFAMTEMKVILSLLLKTFKFTLHEDFPKPKIEINITLTHDANFKLKVSPA